MFWFFVIAVVLFVGYAVWTQYSATPVTGSPAKRVITAVGYALAALVAAAAAWFHAPPPTP